MSFSKDSLSHPLNSEEKPIHIINSGDFLSKNPEQGISVTRETLNEKVSVILPHFLPKNGTLLLNHIKKMKEMSLIPTNKLLEALYQLGQNWLNSDYHYRQEAEKYLPLFTPYSPTMVREAIDITFSEFSKSKLQHLCDKLPEKISNKAVSIHILAGNIFTSGIFGIIYGLMAQSTIIIKPSFKDSLFPVLFTKSLADVHPGLRKYISLLYWDSGFPQKEIVGLYEISDLVITYGNDNTIDTISDLVPSSVKFLGFGHKFSFGIIEKEFLTTDNVDNIAEKVAYDTSMYDQQGCLSPQFFYVQKGGEISPERFSELVAIKMEAINQKLPRGKMNISESSNIIQQRTAYEFRGFLNPSLKVYSSKPNTNWTVIHTEDLELNPSPLNRFLFIKPYKNIHEIIPHLLPAKGKIQCVSLGVSKDRIDEYRKALKQLEINRFCSVGDMQKPGLDEDYPGKPKIEDFLL